MNDSCDYCLWNRLELAYRPPTTERGLSVYLCQQCGLLQSLPRIDHVSVRSVSTTSDAAWGNVRYGKAFRTGAALNALGQTCDLASVRACLDVGSNRGSFVLQFRGINSMAEVWAIEPDQHVACDYSKRPDIRLLSCRLEAVELPPDKFDLVFCCHTLEHLASPRRALQQIHRSMSVGGQLYLEVPRLDFIGRDDIVEEFFIDKHLYHFTEQLLAAYARACGFHIREECGRGDESNIMLVVEKLAEAPKCNADMTDGPAKIRSLIQKYQTTRRTAVAKLRRAARRIEAMTDRRVVVWGAGRIFDSLVRHGRLDTTRLAGVVDRYLPAYLPAVHGLSLQVPEALREIKPCVIVVAAREYATEIRREAQQLCPIGCQVVEFTDLIAA